MISDKKALEYVKQDKVFPLAKFPDKEVWCVDAKTGMWEVCHYYKKETFSCNCLNVRNSECSHIKALRIKLGKV
jgi:hypothetical protein